MESSSITCSVLQTIPIVVFGICQILPKGKKSKRREKSGKGAREDDGVGVKRHLPTPPGEKPLQPGSGAVYLAKSGDIDTPANEEHACGLHALQSFVFGFSICSWFHFSSSAA